MGLGALISRIIGIYLVAHGLGVLAQWLPFFFQGLSGSSIGPIVGPLSVGLVLTAAGLIFFVNADPLSQKLLGVDPVGAKLDSNEIQLIAFRVLALWLLFEAMGHLLTGSVSAIVGQILGPPEEARGTIGIDYYRTQNLVRAVTSGLAAIIQAGFGFWLLMRPESLVARIDRWRRRRSLEPIEEEIDD